MTTTENFDFDLEKYKQLVKAAASISRLFSDSTKAFIHPRFVEKLYVHCSRARDLSRKDISFDAILKNRIGVGIKTFVAEKMDSEKNEKVAEFTNQAASFNGLNSEAIAFHSAELRNNRIRSDSVECGIDDSACIYHCLVRTKNGIFVHEEPYESIDINNIRLMSSLKNSSSQIGDLRSQITYFNDGKSVYSYNLSKNVLYKKFSLSRYRNTPIFKTVIFDNIFDKIIQWTANENQIFSQTVPPSVYEYSSIILPLYSPEFKRRQPQNISNWVQERSGINQWNAGGRKRSFGESYIPIPSVIHKFCEGFFPTRDHKFKIKLPNNKIIVAKICQDGGKALMSDPNADLCDWLFRMIDFSKLNYEKRFQNKQAYTYKDLQKIGKDSVRVIKCDDTDYDYILESAPLNSYEKFEENLRRGTKSFPNIESDSLDD